MAQRLVRNLDELTLNILVELFNGALCFWSTVTALYGNEVFLLVRFVDLKTVIRNI